MSRYEVKWKGRCSGPYSLEELRTKFEAREIGGMHEVSVDGQWMTVRAFFRQNPVQTAPSGSMEPAPVSIQNPSIRQEAVYPSTHGSSNDPEMTPSINREEPGNSMTYYYAGFWIRTTALLLDGLIVIWTPLWIYDYFQDASAILTMDTFRSLNAIQWALVGLAIIVVSWIYFTILEASPLRGSLGKRMVGLQVHQSDGSKIDFNTASVRNLAKAGSGLMLGIGFFLAVFTPNRQTFHDLVSNTVVSQNIPESSTFLVRD